MRNWYVLSVRRYSFVKLWKFTYICTLRTGGGWEGESKFVPGPQCQANACKISRLWGVISSLVFNKSVSKLGNFTNFKTFFPVVSLACLSQKLKKKKMVWSALKEVHFWAAPPSIGHYREPFIAIYLKVLASAWSFLENLKPVHC